MPNGFYGSPPTVSTTVPTPGSTHDIQTRRDKLVQQLLEERRSRLQEKLLGNSSTWNEETPRDVGHSEVSNAASQGHKSSSSSANGNVGIAGFASSAPPGDPWSSFDMAESAVSHVLRDLSNERGQEASAPEEYTFSPSSPSKEHGRSPRRLFMEEASPLLAAGRCTQQATHGDPLQNDFLQDSPPNSRPSSGRCRTNRSGNERKRVPNLPAARAKGPGASQECGGAKLAVRKSPSWPRPRSAPPRSTTSSGPARSQSDFHRRVHEWTLRRQAMVERQLKAREEKQREEVQQCNFKPSIGTRSEFYARRMRSCFLEPLTSRLHHEADQRGFLRQKAKELLEQDEMCRYTFKPKINADRGSPRRGRSADAGQGEHKPLHLRIDEIQRSKKQHLDAMQAANGERRECTFQPRISQRSEKIVERKREDAVRSLSHDVSCNAGVGILGPVEDRLYQEAKEFDRRRSALEDKGNDTFEMSSVSIDSQSEKIFKSSVYFQGAQQDFLTRQQKFEAARDRRMQLRTQHADAECSFQPRLSNVSQQLVAHNMELMGETLDDKVNRLAVTDVERRNDIRDALEQAHYKECSFRPSINPLSQLLGRKEGQHRHIGCDITDDQVSVHERLYSFSRNKASSKDSSYEDSQAAACTFKPSQAPANVKKYAHVKPHYSASGKQLMEGIHDELRKRQDDLQDKREQQAEREVAECTFHPKGSGRARSADADRSRKEPPVIVSGLGRFFELRDLSKRQKEEQRIREQRAFKSPDDSSIRLTGVTVPQPFKLSSTQDGAVPKLTQLRGKLEEEWKSQCTFKPVTVESKNRELIRQMLIDSEDLWT